MTEGIKLDMGKERMDLIPPQLIKEVARVLEFGAQKYGDYNWYGGIKYNRMYAAAMRHMLAFWEGEDCDPESGIHHLAHAATNLAFLLQFISEYRGGLDNRPQYNKPETQKPGGIVWIKKDEMYK